LGGQYFIFLLEKFMLSRIKSAAKNPSAAAVKLANQIYLWAADGERRPAFHDIDSVKPELKILDQNFVAIRDELNALLANKQAIPRYHEVSARETHISGVVDPDKDWRIFVLHCPAGIPRKNQEKCPRTAELTGKIPGLVQAFFSILDPGKSIPAHCGPYLGYLRYHLALRVPKNNPPTMRVKDEIHQWEEGKSILFDDSLEHEVYNKSDETRVVLIVDFMRPMNLLAHALNAVLLKIVPRFSKEAREQFSQVELS
jgi:aspartyl/asparaginyl beta-hydroxylase (cupin superfamily)